MTRNVLGTKHAFPRLQFLLETFCLDKHQNLANICRKPLSTKFHKNPSSLSRVVSRTDRQTDKEKRQLNRRSAPYESAHTFIITQTAELNATVRSPAAGCCKTTGHDSQMNYKKYLCDNYTAVWHVPIGLKHHVLIQWRFKTIAQKQN